jgi:hypothetical protein
LLSSGNSLFDPTDVTSLGEDTESQLVKLSSVEVVNASEWTGDGTDFNVTVSDGSNEFEIRIDKDVELSTMPLPGMALNITGLGGQFDTSSPYDSGYQLLPRYASDIEVILAAKDENLPGLIIYPNPVNGIVHFDIEAEIQELQIFDQLGAKVMEITGDRKQIDMSEMASGLYVLKIAMQTGESGIRRIIKL